MIWLNVISFILFTFFFSEHLKIGSKLDSYDRRNMEIEKEEIKGILYLIVSIIFGIMVFIDYSFVIS